MAVEVGSVLLTAARAMDLGWKSDQPTDNRAMLLRGLPAKTMVWAMINLQLVGASQCQRPLQKTDTLASLEHPQWVARPQL